LAAAWRRSRLNSGVARGIDKADRRNETEPETGAFVAAQANEQGGLATRYAAALFELADAKKALDAVAGDVAALQRMIDESADLRRMMNSPVMGRNEQTQAIAAIAKAAGFAELTQKFAGLVAQNRRLFVLPAMIRAFLKLLADRRGEMTAEVTAARPLTAEQQAAVAEAIKRAVGAKVTIDVKVDPSLLGGLVVRVGSRMIDSSLKTKLQKLQFAMKGIG
jgi:F-type H+-transporting ATPase subunit delta